MQNQTQHVFRRRRKGANQRVSITMTPEDVITLNNISTFLVQSDPTEPMSQSKAACIAFKYAQNYIMQNDMEKSNAVKVFV